MWTSMSGMVLSRLAWEVNPLRKVGAGESLADAVATYIRDFAEALRQAQCMQDGAVDSDADAGVPCLDPLQSGSRRERTFGHDRHGQSATASGVAEVLAQLAQQPSDTGGRIVRRRHM